MKKFIVPAPTNDLSILPKGFPILFEGKKVAGYLNAVLANQVLLVDANANWAADLLASLGFVSGQRLISPEEYDIVPPQNGISLRPVK